MTISALILLGLALSLALGACGVGPAVYSGFGDYHFMGRPRPPEISPHTGVDFAARIGEAVLAAADGTVTHVGAMLESYCGIGVYIKHMLQVDDPNERVYYTYYCHLSQALVSEEQHVRRGEIIARAGQTGRYAGQVPHLHFELQIGPGRMRVDPMQAIVGCFVPTGTYPTDRPVLTYPVKC